MQILSKKSHTAALLAILFLALLVRLYKITTPPLDWHSFRQADTASVSRMYVEKGIDLLHPTYHDVSNIASGKDNLAGYRMVEFPVLNASVAFIVRLMPSFSLDVVSRVQSVVLSLGTLIFLFLLTSGISGKRVGYVTLILGAFLPYFVYYSRAILPEAGMLFFSTGALYFFFSWAHEKKLWQYVLSLLFLSLALLMKPFVLFLFPVFFAIWFIYTKKIISAITTFLLLILAVGPMLWWRQWILQFPSGIPASDWLYNGDGIRFRPAWFRWLFFERLTKLILGYVGVVFLPLSVYAAHKREVFIYGAWWGGVLIYLSVIATGNVRHDYYQNLLVPIILITVARGVCVLESFIRKKLSPAYSFTATLLLVIAMLSLSWYRVKEYYIVNHWEYVRAGAAVQRFTPPDALVIANALGDTQFLYQTHRSGWPIGFSIDKKIELGAKYYITTSKDDEANELRKRFFVIDETDEYLIIDLTHQR